jgi:hypothetical protein
MKCIHCGYTKAKVIDTTGFKDLNSRKRLRVCLKCDRTFTTVEVPGTVRTVNQEGVEVIVFDPISQTADSVIKVVPREEYVPRVPHGTTTGGV